jgi:hypothetical protein
LTDYSGSRARSTFWHGPCNTADFQYGEFEPEGLGRCLNLHQFQHGVGKARVGHDRQSAKTGDNLGDELDALARKIGSVAASAALGRLSPKRLGILP